MLWNFDDKQNCAGKNEEYAGVGNLKVFIIMPTSRVCSSATMHTCMYSLFSGFFQIRNAHVLIFPGHDILLVSFVLWSVLEYNDAKCKIKL